MDHLQDGAARASAQVVRDAANLGVGLELVQGRHVPLCQVHDVDVVTHACAVSSGIVIAKYRQDVPLP